MKILYSTYLTERQVEMLLQAFFDPKVAKRIAKQQPSGRSLVHPQPQRLLRSGATEAQVDRFVLTIELAKRIYMPVLAHYKKSPSDHYPGISPSGLEKFRAIVDPLMQRIGTEPNEYFVVVALDKNLDPIAAEALHVGTEASVAASMAHIIRYLREVNAEAFLVAHNHPSQDAAPSVDDIALTHRLHDCAALAGIPLVDHVVITGQKAWSIRASAFRQLDGYALPREVFYEVPFDRDDMFTSRVPWIEGARKNDIGIRFGSGKKNVYHDAQVFLAAEGVAPHDVPAEEILGAIAQDRVGEQLSQSGWAKASLNAIGQLWAAKELIINACKMGDSLDRILGPNDAKQLCPLLKKARVDVAFIGLDARQFPMIIIGGNYIEKISSTYDEEAAAHPGDIRKLSSLLQPEVQMLSDYGAHSLIILTRFTGTAQSKRGSMWPRGSYASEPHVNELGEKLTKVFALIGFKLLDIVEC